MPMSNETLPDVSSRVSPEEIGKQVDYYKNVVYSRFERAESCGKKTEDGERRCLHYVISPLDYDPPYHEFDLGALKRFTQQVSFILI